MKALLIICLIAILQVRQPFTVQPKLAGKIWYCAKFTSMGEMNKIDRHNPVFRFGLSFINPVGQKGQRFSHFSSDIPYGTYSGCWILEKNKLTLTPSDNQHHPQEVYEVIPTGDPNFMILQVSGRNQRYFMVLGD